MTLTELYEEYELELRRYARRWTRDAYRIDDLVQECFIRAMGHLELLGLLEPYQRRAWLHRTLKNLFLDQESARQREEALIEQMAQEAPLAGYLSQEVIWPNPFDLVPGKYRDLVRKRYILGMTSQEIASELGVPAATVRSRLHLALKKLRLQAYKLR